MYLVGLRGHIDSEQAAFGNEWGSLESAFIHSSQRSPSHPFLRKNFIEMRVVNLQCCVSFKYKAK